MFLLKQQKLSPLIKTRILNSYLFSLPALLDSQNRDVLNTPKKNPSKYSSPPGSPTPNPWLNSGEVSVSKESDMEY